MAETRKLFALDQGFPQPIVAALSSSIREADLTWIGDIDARLTDVDDWQIFHALHADKRPWAGLITTDSGILSLPKELAVLCQTKLTLVVTESAGHDPLKATGLVLTHLPEICNQTAPDEPQLWVLRSTKRKPTDPWQHLTKAAKREKKRPQQLYREQKLRDDVLARAPDLRGRGR